ncbi:MAG: rhamnan synthesis F family protein [Aristaeellaceae bacterium]
MTAACAQALEKEKERTAAALQDRDRIIADDRAAEEKLQHDLLDISRRFAEAQRELESRAQEAARLREEIGKEQAQSISLTEERNQLSARANELKVAHDYAVSQWSQAARTIELLQQELQNVRNEVSLITNGISWKVTKPLRYGKKLLKKGVARVGLLGWRTGRTVYRAVRRGCRRKAALTAAQAALAGTWPPHFEKQPDRVPASTLEQANVKRLGIFTFYEKDGVVDGYVLYFLEHLVKLTERLVIVVNGKLSTDGRKALQKITGEIVLRDNTGFDAWGVREGLMHVGLKKVAGYDELIVANDTNFGPVLPLEDMVNTMAARKVDFWGISSHAGFESDPFQCNPYGFVPEHVQSYFYAVRRSLLGSEVFRRFWTELPALPDYNHAVGLYETVMTRYFTEHGYTWSTYMDAEAYYPLTDNPLIAAPVEAIRDYHCPIFKRRAFFQDYDYLTTYTGQHTAAQLMQYLEEETDYPTDLIWENLIRTVHMCDLVQNLHLAQILDKHHYYGPAPQRLQESINAALFMHIYDTSMAAEMAAYAASMPPEADVFISTTSEEKKQQILACFGSLPNQLEIRVCPNRGRDVSGLLANFKDVVMNYAVICVTHDKKTAYLKPETVGEGFAYMGYENILGSRAFVLNVLNAFARNKYLGLLYTPDPNHADFGTHIGLEWGPNFAATKELAQALHLHVPMDEKKPPCAPFGSNFWARSDALKPLFDKDWTYEDFPPEPFKALDGSILHAVERSYPYSAQQAGYYSALLMTTDYSAIELGNLQYNAQAYAHVCFDHGIANRYITVRDLLDMRLTTLEEAGYVPAVTVNESGQVVPAAGAGFLQKIRGRVYNLAGKVKRTLDRWNEQ